MAELVRESLLNDITNRLASLVATVTIKNPINLTDVNVHAESFFVGFLNRMFEFNLRNANEDNQNAKGIDLVDYDNKILVQVTSTCTKAKIEHSLSEITDKYSGFHFYFLPLVIHAKAQKKNSYNAPFGIRFNPEDDILDLSAIEKHLFHEPNLRKIKDISEFVKTNIRTIFDSNTRLESGLDYIIRQLSLDETEVVDFDLNDFTIDAKIKFNNLSYGNEVINQYVPYYMNAKRIYDEYAHQGQNKSNAVLQKLHKVYILHKQLLVGDELFRKIESEIKSMINKETLPVDTTEEVLDMCVDILMVHAFMECKIFEKPI